MNMQKFDNHRQHLPKASGGSYAIQKYQIAPDMPSLNIMDEGNQFILGCLTSIEQMEAIGEEWKTLEQTCGEPYIYFQSYDWCMQWCLNFVSQKQPVDGQSLPGIRIYTLRRNSRLIMLWPMMLQKSTMGLIAQSFLGDPHGQYSNIICKRKYLPSNVAENVWQHIRKNSDADALVLDQYPQSSFLAKLVQNNGIVESSDKYSEALDLTAFDTWEEYHASQSRNSRKQRKQRRNKLSKMGILGYETHYGGSKRYQELVAIGLEWKNIWLKHTGRRVAVLSDERTRKLLSNLVGNPGSQTTSPTGAIIGVLTLDEKPIALEIGLAEAGRFYSYLGAFDWEYKNYSPGKLQIEETQAWAKATGFKTFDFLGDSAEYKASLTNSRDALESRSVALTMRGFLYCVFWKAYLRPAIRSIFNKLMPEHRSKLLKLFGMGEYPAENTKAKTKHAAPQPVGRINNFSSD